MAKCWHRFATRLAYTLQLRDLHLAIAHSTRDFVTCALIAVSGASLHAGVAHTQVPGNLGGQVSDSAGTPVSGAVVTVVGSSVRSTTDEGGQFRLSGVPSGTVEVRVRRLGFAPLTRQLGLRSRESLVRLQFRMARVPGTLNTVLVRTNRFEYSGRLAGYYQRLQRHTGGHFISRDEIDRKSFRSLTQLLNSVPGINSFALRSGGGTVRMRGQSCRPMVWLDGVAMPAAEVDLDAFPTSTLHGVELYFGSSSAPSDFIANEGVSGCGTILLWSRGADTDPAPTRASSKVDLEQLIESLTVFSADQVARPAELLNAASLEVKYPVDLFAAGVIGSVVAEFVVDTTGRIEPGTFSVVTSSDPRFSSAVQSAIANARYTPAVKDGKAVRQAVQQPFSFLGNQPAGGQGSRQSIKSR